MYSFHELITRRLIPAYVFWELTRRCNLSCRHCYSEQQDRGELRLDEARTVIAKLKRMNALVINFSGGEALLRRDFFEIASLAAENNFAVKLFSNGTLIDRQTAKRIKALKPLSVDISLYGGTPQVHDMITGVKGSWKRSVDAVQLLRRQGTRVKIKCSLMKDNFPVFRETLAFFKKLTVPFQFNTVLMPPHINADVRGAPMDADEHALALKQLLRYSKDRRGGIAREKSPLCGAGITSLAINAYGDITPCVSLPLVLGNVLKDDMQRVWLHHEFLAGFRQIRNADISGCNRCADLNYCARCPGIAFLKTGNLMSPYKEACTIAAARKYNERCQDA